MKKLVLFSLKSFIGPFVITFIISMFILIMQFFWKYIDDLMGKGLGINIIIELLFYVSAVLIPLALPLAVLLSSIMSMGNLAEHNELTALKATGMSLFRIMRPLFAFMIFLSIVTFYSSNYVIPMANLKMRTLIYDIQQTKIASIIKPGTFSKDIKGYSIKVGKSKGNRFQQVTIYDETNAQNSRSIKADSGEVFKSDNGDFLFFKLYSGNMNEEMTTDEAVDSKEQSSFHPARKSAFETATFKLNLTGFKIERTDEELFKDQFEMMNIFQLRQSIDSVKISYNKITADYAKSFAKKQSYIYARDLKDQFKDATLVKKSTPHKDTSETILYNNIPQDKLKIAYQLAITKLNSQKIELQGQYSFFSMKAQGLIKIDTELHKKFALCASVLVLFFIGAPLGAIVKKGGFGAPVVIAVFLFMIYYIISITGENMVTSETVAPWFGIWLSTIILSPIAIYLNWKANRDEPLFTFEWVTLLKKRLARK